MLIITKSELLLLVRINKEITSWGYTIIEDSWLFPIAESLCKKGLISIKRDEVDFRYVHLFNI